MAWYQYFVIALCISSNLKIGFPRVQSVNWHSLWWIIQSIPTGMNTDRQAFESLPNTVIEKMLFENTKVIGGLLLMIAGCWELRSHTAHQRCHEQVLYLHYYTPPSNDMGQMHLILTANLDSFSIYGLARSELMREHITYVTSPVSG